MKKDFENLGFKVMKKESNIPSMNGINEESISSFTLWEIKKRDINYKIYEFTMKDSESAIQNNYMIYKNLKNRYKYVEGNAIGNFLVFVVSNRVDTGEGKSILEIYRSIN